MKIQRQIAVQQALRVVLMGLVPVAMLATTPSAASAAPTGSTAFCRWSGPVTITPGLSATTVTKASLVTESGHPLDCTGSINGHDITGPGTYDDEKPTIEGSCESGTGTAIMKVTIPTSAGPQTLRIPYTYKYGPLSGFKSSGSSTWAGPVPIDTGSDDLTWTFIVYPLAGDCVSSPVTRIGVQMEGVFRT